MMRVIIAGGRDFNNYELLELKCDRILLFPFTHPDEIEIVSGHCNGADILGEQYGKERGCKVKLFPADWAKHGKAAGPIRNKEMAEYGTHLIAFWDGFSRGTKNMIATATQSGLKVRVIKIN